jgi:hypothetical protein
MINGLEQSLFCGSEPLIGLHHGENLRRRLSLLLLAFRGGILNFIRSYFVDVEQSSRVQETWSLMGFLFEDDTFKFIKQVA